MDAHLPAARKDARELRLMIRRRWIIAVSAVVLALLSVAAISIVKTTFGDAKSAALSAALGIVAMVCLGGAILVTHHVLHLRLILKDIERVIDRR
jgi:hypothetical protein